MFHILSLNRSILPKKQSSQVIKSATNNANQNTEPKYEKRYEIENDFQSLRLKYIIDKII